MVGHHDAGKLGKHHVVPEVPQVKEHTQDDDETQHEHVLGSPLHLRVAVGHFITLATAGLAVLHREDEGIDDVDDHQRCQSESCHYGVPVAAKKFTNHVVSLAGE